MATTSDKRIPTDQIIKAKALQTMIKCTVEPALTMSELVLHCIEPTCILRKGLRADKRVQMPSFSEPLALFELLRNRVGVRGTLLGVLRD